MIGLLSTLVWLALSHDRAVLQGSSTLHQARGAVTPPAREAAFAVEMAKGDKAVAVRRHERRKRNVRKAGEYYTSKTSKPIENQFGSKSERLVHFRSGGPLVEAVQEAYGSRWDREIYAYVLIGIGLTAFVINFFVNFPEVEVPDSNDLLGIEQDAGQTLAIIGRQNSQKVVQSLKERTELTDPRVLRGIPLHGILCYMGDILIPSGGIGGGASEETFARSQKVDSLDFFLSHSWRDSGRLKWLLLLWQMNFRFAFLVSNVVGAVALAAFCAYPSLQNMNTFVISHVMRIGVAVLLCLLLVYGHHLTGTNPMIFLDKACINQTDPELKEKGIKNIGGFLRNSDCMLHAPSDARMKRSLHMGERGALAPGSDDPGPICCCICFCICSI